MVPPFIEVAPTATDSAPGPLSLALTLPPTEHGRRGHGAAPTTNWVLPTPPVKVSLPATGRTVIVVFRVLVQPKLSVTVTTTAPFSAVLVGGAGDNARGGMDGQPRRQSSRAPREG